MLVTGLLQGGLIAREEGCSVGGYSLVLLASKVFVHRETLQFFFPLPHFPGRPHFPLTSLTCIQSPLSSLTCIQSLDCTLSSPSATVFKLNLCQIVLAFTCKTFSVPPVLSPLGTLTLLLQSLEFFPACFRPCRPTTVRRPSCPHTPTSLLPSTARPAPLGSNAPAWSRLALLARR